MDKFKKLVNYVLNITDYVIAWVNKRAKGAIKKLTGGLNPKLNQSVDDQVNRNGQPQTNKEFIDNIEKFVKGGPAERFFKDKPNFIKELAEKAAALADNSSTPICNPDLLPKTTQVTLHQQVIYCDDSSSMKRDGRWDSQSKLVNRIARITTRILPEGEGVALRFINQEVEGSTSLTFEKIGEILQPLKWDPNGDTPIGTNLKSKILEPLVYSKLGSKKLERPLLVSIITDGMPSQEPKSALVDEIVECGNRLEGAGYARATVKFVIGQVGTAESATRFMQDLSNEPKIADIVFVATEKLDIKASQLESDWDMDKWLIETLYSPIQNSEAKKTK